ncbi:MAG: CHAD domain-containing protein [Pseudomonadota bacterium]
MTVEIELKLGIAAADAGKLRRHPALRAKAMVRRLYSIYFDTPDLTLQRHDVALRLRRSGKSWVQTIKGGGTVAAGLHAREEWEMPLPRPVPDLAQLPTTALARLLYPLRERLQPVFATEFSRTTREVRLADGATLEFCLDRGRIMSGGAAENISEIELELKDGTTRSLFEFALELIEYVPLRLEDRSKAERGYRLFSGSAEVPRKAGTPALAAEMDAAAAGKAVCWHCLAHLQANQRGMLAGADIEYLHQMRVALRRLHSAGKLFGIAPEAALAGELEWLSDALGAARDWDVFVAQTLPPIVARFDRQPGLPQLVRRCERLRLAAGKSAREAVASQRYQRLLLTLGAWLESPAWQAGNEMVTKFAGAVLERIHGRVLRRGRRLARLDAAQRHRLRIAVKRLRYSMEFFAALYPAKRVRAQLRALAALQDLLGALNDDATLQRLLERLEPARLPQAQQLAIAVVRGWSAGQAHRCLKDLRAAWLAYTETAVFW